MLTPEELEAFKELRWKKFAPQVFGYSFLVVIASSAWSIYLAKDFERMSALDAFTITFLISFPMTIPAFAYCLIFFYRLLDNLGASHLNRYMLYLRPFSDDGNVIDKNEIREAFGNQWPLLSALSGSSPNFDVFISRAFRRTIYTVVSLGNPRDFMPQPGTKKIYPKNEEWKKYVSRLIDNADAVFLRCSNTDGFKWELKYLIEQNLLERSMLYVGLEKSELELWNSAALTMRDCGVAVPTEFPGFGTTIGFTDNKKAFIVTKTATSPSIYREKILQQLKGLGGKP